MEDFDNTIASLSEENYEIRIAKCAKSICQVTGDKFAGLQSKLLKHIFGGSEIGSLFASDLYMFAYRLIHPDFRSSMRQIIANLCQLAPPHGETRGTALLHRLARVT